MTKYDFHTPCYMLPQRRCQRKGEKYYFREIRVLSSVFSNLYTLAYLVDERGNAIDKFTYVRVVCTVYVYMSNFQPDALWQWPASRLSHNFIYWLV
jgi:hypothetical protein